MTRAVLDTNVYVSALVFGGKPARVLQLAAAGTFLIASGCAVIRPESPRILCCVIRNQPLTVAASVFIVTTSLFASLGRQSLSTVAAESLAEEIPFVPLRAFGFRRDLVSQQARESRKPGACRVVELLGNVIFR